ncbi:MAG: murein DD-endopeptidase MepM/ murein hydrolase activator NlpD [Phenylobacterium sp.]|jgi:murein DD-endopeptidase MepM/ murein hydrolase activator NlpD
MAIKSLTSVKKTNMQKQAQPTSSALSFNHQVVDNMNQLVKHLPRQHKIFISTILVFFVILMFIPAEKANASRDPAITNITLSDSELEAVVDNSSQADNQLIPGKSYALTLDLSAHQPHTDTTDHSDNLKWQEITVKNGDNLAKIFKRAGFSAKTLFKITSLGKPTKILTKIHPGERVSFASDRNSGQLQQLHYSLNEVSTLIVSLDDTLKYKAHTQTKNVEIRTEFASATINSNFWNAGVNSGLVDAQIMNLANIFGWDIDFALDIRDGDTFSVVYETRYIDGEAVGNGNIVAAEFVNQGENFQAVRYKDGEYYNPEGRSMRKAFLRAPVNFKYVSSSFKKRRFHPTQKRWKAHRGVDYAAKTGTPVVAAGNGRVLKSTYNRFNGNYVFIEHGNGITTKYLHFSKRAVKKGARVKQGQVIGYVGSTGLSSGPHLHFEFIKNGVHRNPRTVKMPKAKPIAKKEKRQFLKVAKAAMNSLNSNKRVLLAFQP